VPATCHTFLTIYFKLNIGLQLQPRRPGGRLSWNPLGGTQAPVRTLLTTSGQDPAATRPQRHRRPPLQKGRASRLSLFFCLHP
jgi:hypothetical protein